MRIIPIIGLTFFLKPYIQHKSFRLFLIIINGLLYHGLRTKNNYNEPIIKILRYYDIIINLILILEGMYTYPKLIIYSYIAIINFTFNFFILQRVPYFKQHISMDLREYFHVIGVQLPLALGIDKAFYETKKLQF